MNIDPGSVVVIAATLIFYLRLIVIQRQRAKQAAAPTPPADRKQAKRGRQAGGKTATYTQRYSILSPRKMDWVISGIGILAIVAGILMNRGVFNPGAFQAYWWIPTSAGIVAFSWAFRL